MNAANTPTVFVYVMFVQLIVDTSVIEIGPSPLATDTKSTHENDANRVQVRTCPTVVRLTFPVDTKYALSNSLIAESAVEAVAPVAEATILPLAEKPPPSSPNSNRGPHVV